MDVAQRTVTGPRSDLEALAGAYRACECGDEFSGVNGSDDPKVKQLFENLKGYLGSNLSCSGPGGTAALVDTCRRREPPTSQ